MYFDVIVAFCIGTFTLGSVIWLLRHINLKNDIEIKSEKVTVAKISERKAAPKKVQISKKSDAKFKYEHEYLLAILKGHSGNLTDIDISSNGRLIVSTGIDRSIFLWKFKEITKTDRKVSRGAIEYDHGSHVKFSPDDKVCLVLLKNKNFFRIEKIKKEENSYSFCESVDIEQDLGDNSGSIPNSDIISIGIASTGAYLMTCYASPPLLMLWSLKGSLLQRIDTGTMTNYQAAVSPCGRVLAVCGFTAEVRLWSVTLNKQGQFVSAAKACALPGHTCSVVAIAFTPDSSKLVTVSKTGNWRLWNINVDFRTRDPERLSEGHCGEALFSSKGMAGASGGVHACLSSCGNGLVVSRGTSLAFIDTDNNLPLGTASVPVVVAANCHTDSVCALRYDSRRQLFFSAGGRYINVWSDFVSAHAKLRQLREKLRVATATNDKTAVRRLTEYIRDAEQVIADLKTEQKWK